MSYLEDAVFEMFDAFDDIGRGSTLGKASCDPIVNVVREC